jgi:hypothetical protein
VHTLHHILTTRTEPRGFIKPSVYNQAVHMELSLRMSFLPQMQPRGLHGEHQRGIPSQDRGGFSPMISPPNPAEVPTVTYEYMLYPPSSDQLRPPTQQRARGLLLGSSTLSTAVHRLRYKILATTGSLQRQTARELYTQYRIKPHHSRLKRRCHQPKKN